MTAEATRKELLSRAIALGRAQHQAGRLDEAESLYRHVLTIAPDEPEALHLLGVAENERGRPERAVELIGRAIAARSHPQYYNNRGDALLKLERVEEAIADFTRAIALRPGYARAEANLGKALDRAGRTDEAIGQYERAVSASPEHVELLNGLGCALLKQGREERAAACFRRVIELDPSHSGAHSNLGSLVLEEGRPAEAIRLFLRAIELDPDDATALANLGGAYQQLGRLEEAAASYEAALARDPAHVLARWNRALSLLLAGNLNEGWKDYEKRLNANPRKFGPDAIPWWDGSSLRGKRILLWGEQGLGDEIIFSSMVADVARDAAHTILECDARLAALFARSFPGVEIVERREPAAPRRDVDVQCSSGSLARWLRPAIDSFPRRTAYLKPDRDRARFWRERLDALGPGLKIGIVWRSKNMKPSRLPHYTKLEQWAPILTVPGVHFINLQYDECGAELAMARERFGVEVHTWADLDLMKHVDEGAALKSALDLAISPVISEAHIASAVGTPVWELAYPVANGWFFLGTDGVPWFPGVRVFRREIGGEWEPVLERVGAELRALVTGRVDRSLRSRLGNGEQPGD